MSSFSGSDYDHLFELGRTLYNHPRIARQVAVRLMAMAESVRGQQSNWPKIHPHFRHLTTYTDPRIGAWCGIPFKYRIITRDTPP